MPVRWNRIVPNKLLPIAIYNGYSVSRQLLFKYSVRVNVSAGLGELEVKDVGKLDSGTYACHQLNSSVNNAVFHLYVAGKPCLFFFLSQHFSKCSPNITAMQKVHSITVISKLRYTARSQNKKKRK